MLWRWIIYVMGMSGAFFSFANEVTPDASKGSVMANLYGQLGNNLYQIAAASALAWDHGAEPYFPHLDPTAEQYFPGHDLGPKPSACEHIFFRCKKKAPNEPVTFVWNEPSNRYHPIPFQAHMKINGYFQSEKYFAHQRQRILELFAPHPDDLEHIREKYGWLLDHPHTVGVQIRHYKSDPTLGDLYPQYGRDYLEKAMAHFPETTLFVVSSDNLDFARKQMPSSVKNVVFLENEPYYIDFHLLSFCKHNIISNSSFGWWCAWLNQNPDRKVIRPAKFINNNMDTQDLCPDSWIVIEAAYE